MSEQPRTSEATVTYRGTPNPDAVRFTLTEAIGGDCGWSFVSREGTGEDARTAAPRQLRVLADSVLDVPGVESLYIVNKMATVSRARGASWDTIVPKVTPLLQDACDAFGTDT